MTTTRIEPTLAAAGEYLRQQAERIEDDPMTNSVFALAQTLFRDIEQGETGLDEVAGLIEEAHLLAVSQRAERLRERHSGARPEAVWPQVQARLESVAAEGIEAFRAAVEQAHGGVVFTAHPTFSLSPELRVAIAGEAVRPGADTRAALQKAIRADARDWNRSITLTREHEEAQAALLNAAGAQRHFAGLIFDVARAQFPADWHGLRPALPTIASWVGYDLDGRTDIQWYHSITFRLAEKAEQLRRYHARVEAILNTHPGADSLAQLLERLELAVGETAIQAAMFSGDLQDPDHLVDAANRLTAEGPGRLTNAGDILAALDSALTAAGDNAALARELLILRAQVDSQQLGTGRIHLRVNAAQIANVIRRELNLDADERSLGRLTLTELSRRAAVPKAVDVNFADLFLEQSTARRQFMMCAQILKHIDAGSPIRFLIAESENPATVMAALYLARHYGVNGNLDISPLFETPEALETGGRFIERLLDEPEFATYVRRRGHLSIQLGFSDSGRFIGQIAGNMAIERIHNLILRAMAPRVPGAGLLIFNTHGESMGRGAWPGTFEQRFDHLLTPWTRANAHELGIRIIHESSFQGGDGYLHFATPELAETTLAHWCLHLLAPPPESAATDPFYTRTDLVWDFYRALRAWHERFFSNADYGRLLSDFAPGFVVTAGSRQTRRPSGAAGPRALRAISHNAELQQLAIPLNTASGIGSSLQRETDRLVDLVNASPRMSSLVQLAWRARLLTSLPVLRGYAAIYNPDVWIAHARAASPEETSAYRGVYYALRDGETALSVNRTANLLSIDLDRFDRLLARLDEAPSTASRHEDRINLHIIHGVRQALMMRAFALVGRLPRISERHDTSLRDIIRLVTSLRIAECVELLCRIFPPSQDRLSLLSSLEEAGGGESGPGQYGYDHIHSQIIGPLDRIDQMLHQISLALNHPHDAVG
ncbi:putative phosphoenolpyruvate carboxylase [Hyphomonas neptunium ATCC 15444]|uniref:Phosphoenolpyruvate carboxylase n=2 Tax=Hyphomonas TaxID=85 RepID=Q0C350_HYPNA|nr:MULTISPECIES: phosphoenolpyruvate carboxylase [Hyphomonas]ABI76335.1 putative phosphoenolpyruvate carboxylase [Hyphomonas neptunium ATCC 15444]KCZ95922.1 phosphoenolpyruvate carboxylase [Hyphomonas hirschiana VP5]